MKQKEKQPLIVIEVNPPTKKEAMEKIKQIARSLNSIYSNENINKELFKVLD